MKTQHKFPMPSNPARIQIIGARLAFPQLDEPKQFQGQGKARYDATALIPKEDKDTLAAVEKAMRAAAVAKWGEAKADQAVKGLKAGGKVAFQDGDSKADWDGFTDHMYIGAHAQKSSPPTLVDAARNALPRDTSVIYAGCYCVFNLEFWAQDNDFGKRINCTVRGVQFYKDGDSFGAGAPASEDEFEAIDGAESAPDDFA